MRADLVKREPVRLERWEKEGLYDQIQSARSASKEVFVLHDGPPFANGDVHIGTALNKILKDIILKYQTTQGKKAPYIPGWDCHGLPIEFKVTQELRKQGKRDANAAMIRSECDAYARRFIDIQRGQFRRLGVLGDWDNPYLTLDKSYEAQELRMFADIVEKGFVYRGKKPVYWSIPCKTALAEAEVEYADHVSQSVIVKFPVVDQPNMFVLIWTTTPWTLPANLAVAFNSQFSYSLVQVGEEAYILSTLLLDKVAEQCGWESFQIIRSLDGEEVGQLSYRHPFCDRTGKLFAGDHFVENTSGTGFVHIAPGHGQDDYLLGRDHGLPIYSPVDDEGCLCHTADLPVESQMPAELLGRSILAKKGKSEANEAVLTLLTSLNVLVHQEDYFHSYPHCWRSKTPVIFRAMDQWFINVDHKGFRDQALECIRDQVSWVPNWGQNRIQGAVSSRPDWCISRQRTWGVPIPAFFDSSGVPSLDPDVIRNTADLFEELGSNSWFEMGVEELWARVKPAGFQGEPPTKKSQDTLDVWIDSGSSSRSVVAMREELGTARTPDGVPQADMYLEGSDQHRGWFQSSLLLSLAANGAAPYRSVLTHGFMVDADREKISKSKQGQGGYEKPQTAEAYVGQWGADIVRLWVASQDYRNDIVVSEERIKKVSEAYRLLRNTLRFQLSNLFDFDSAADAVETTELTGIDRWALEQFAKLETDVKAAYEAHEFHLVYQRVTQFASVELSSIFHDVTKDRLYCDRPDSPRRRATQTVLHRMVGSLIRMLSPILAFTTDEAWESYQTAGKESSPHLSIWKPSNFQRDDQERDAWDGLFVLREKALKALEEARSGKIIGKALEAVVYLVVTSDQCDVLTPLTPDFGELLGVSAVRLVDQGAMEALETEESVRSALVGSGVAVVPAGKLSHHKCIRCWRWEPDVGEVEGHPELCGRCASAIS